MEYEMKRAILQVTDWFFLRFLSSFNASYCGKISVIENPLPDDCEIIRAWYNEDGVFNILLHSESFETVKDGEEYPIVACPVFQKEQ